ncbi:unnamed protein product [Caenorhabditis bovis]|uniref:Cyclic nucleotide-binding domain-containing protein n=1 Tax=Caenorhabditis bovis TaxID=2654633 RepID=A0A8S1EG48_9PELO|nr:unnamed protein product [Caenorhabditis bovis]
MSQCPEMSVLSTSPILLCSLTFNLTICLAALPILIWANYKLWSMSFSKLFHLNFRLVAQVNLFGFIIHCTGRSILHTIDLINYMTLEPCDMVPNIYRCFVLRFMYNCGIWLTTASIIPYIVERWLATTWSKSYEHSSKHFGILLMSIASIPLSFLYYGTRFEGVKMYYCVVVQSGSPRLAQVSAILGIVAQAISRIAFSYLLMKNKNLRRNLSLSLSNRYQIEQNVSSMRCLKVLANINTIYLIIQNAGFFWLLCFAAKIPPQNYYALSEMNATYPLFSILTVLIMSKTVNRVRSNTRKNLDAHLKTDNEVYFKILKKQLN